MKIKKVDITGFRAYEKHGDGTFDFTINNGEVADFVSIFAPNGFGKSSFYDAIEWAITNNISRYTRDSLRSNNDSTSLYLNTKKSGQSILRNRYISDSDPTNVVVETTSTDPFKRELRKAANGRRDFKFDPKDTDPATKHLTEIFLSQDAIDSFLKEEKPESRYEKFMSNFGGEDEEYRLKINALLKTCVQEIKGLKQEELRLQGVLNEPIHKQGLQHINDTIQTLRGFGENLELVDTQYSLSIDLDYKNSIAIKRQENLSTLGLLKEKKLIVNECLVGLKNFFHDKNQELNLRKRLFSLESNKLELDERNKFIASVSELESKLGLLAESIASHNIHKSNLESYRINKQLIKDYDVRRSNLINESNALRANLILNQQRFENSIVAITKLDHNFNKSKEDLSNAQNKFSKITSIESELSLLEAQLEAIKDKLLSYQSTIQDRKKKIEQVNNLDVSRDLLNLSKFTSVNVSNDLINKLVGEINRSNFLKSLIDKYSREQNQLGDQQDSIVQLVSLARELITHTKSEICPLCSQKYESYQALVERILNNKGLSLQQKKISAQIEEAESELILLSKSISESVGYIEDLKNTKIKILESELNKNLDEQDEYVLNRQAIMLNIEQIEAELVDLKDQTFNLSWLCCTKVFLKSSSAI
ncbi:AAA family ATPase [Acinetobacter guillouiae]|uniref:AAA family ATPase n=1 Tax=Acinetobacter guillouiae TaxID=106649 RepID=UPI002FDAC66F